MRPPSRCIPRGRLSSLLVTLSNILAPSSLNSNATWGRLVLGSKQYLGGREQEFTRDRRQLAGIVCREGRVPDDAASGGIGNESTVFLASLLRKSSWAVLPMRILACSTFLMPGSAP